MRNSFMLGALLLLSVQMNNVQAYGSSSSASHCDKPVFSDFQPAVNKYLQSFNEFSFVASANTAASSIVVHLGMGEKKLEFKENDLEITPRKNGKLEVSGKVDRPIEGGFIRLSVSAHSKPGCEHTDGILIRIH